MSDSSLENLPFAPSEDPFVVEHGGFYRRWFSMIEDMVELKTAVASLKGTTDDLWVPLWRGIGARHEAQAEEFAAQGERAAAREKFLLAKTYYSIARFPRPLTPLKEEANRDCIRAYLRSCEFLDPPARSRRRGVCGRAHHFPLPRAQRRERREPRARRPHHVRRGHVQGRPRLGGRDGA